MREKIAEANGFVLYKQYAEPQAAHILGLDLSTLKRKRRAGKIIATPMGERKIRYLGIHIADAFLKGID